MFAGFNLQHVRIVSSYWVRFSMRTGGGIMALFLAMSVGLMVAQAFIAPVEQFVDSSPGAGHTEGEAAQQIEDIATSEGVVHMVGQLIDDQDQAEYLLNEQPALLSVIWLVLLMLFPFISTIGSFNQTAGDIGSRGLRYLLLRTQRCNVYLGRSLGTFFFGSATIVLLLTVVLLYVGLKLRLYPFGDLAVSGLHGFLALLFLSLPYIALCGWISSLFESAFASLAISLLVVGFPILFFKMVNWATRDTDLSWLEQLLPWGWKYDLLSPDWGTRLLAMAVMIGFTLVFHILGLRHFQGRDI